MIDSDASTVSVVIPWAGDDAAGLLAQLEALQDQEGFRDFDVIVAVNRASALAEANNLIARLGRDGWSALDASQRVGPSHARNRGWRTTTARTVLFCDADDLVPSSWVADMTGALVSADIVGGPLENVVPPGGLSVRSHVVDVPTKKFHRWDVFSSCSLGLTREALVALDGWDEKLLAGEDADLCIRGSKLGLRLARGTRAPIKYTLRRSFRSTFKQHRQYGRSDVILARRHLGSSRPIVKDLARTALLVPPRLALSLHGSFRRGAAVQLGLLTGWALELLQKSKAGSHT